MRHRYDYFWAKGLVKITGVVFAIQIIVEVGGIINRKAGFEWVIYVCGVAFLCSLLYSVTLIFLNAWNKVNSND